jgi:hypothetical protein
VRAEPLKHLLEDASPAMQGRGESSDAGRGAYATARRERRLVAMPSRNLVDRRDELVDSLAFERGADVVGVDPAAYSW